MEKRALKLLALKDVKGYGNKRILDMIKADGDLSNVYTTFLKSSLIDEKKLIQYEKILDFCKENKIHVISYFDEIYPSNLKKISSPPLLLFAKGNLDLLKMPSISIVGTRQASKKSVDWAYNSSKELANLGYVIISGGALGIDTAAHKGALGTICVLGSGLNNLYPKENVSLFETISQKGLLISEHAPENHVSPVSLLERNRITSGLGDKILIVCTKLKGGAMSQYKVALSQKKEIFCPNPDLSLEPIEGINQIVRDNKKVKVINEVKDILEENQKILTVFN